MRSKVTSFVERYITSAIGNAQSCYATDLSSGKENLISIRDAIYENKLAGITKTDWVFDFSDCDQLEISEYIINVGELS